MLAAEQARVRRIFVDEFQDVDPAQADLVGVLASGADELVVFGDPDQSIYAFRGSDQAALRDLDVDATVMLDPVAADVRARCWAPAGGSQSGCRGPPPTGT